MISIGTATINRLWRFFTIITIEGIIFHFSLFTDFFSLILISLRLFTHWYRLFDQALLIPFTVTIAASSIAYRYF